MEYAIRECIIHTCCLIPDPTEVLFNYCRMTFRHFSKKIWMILKKIEQKTSCCCFIFRLYVYKSRMDIKCCWMIHISEFNRAWHGNLYHLKMWCIDYEITLLDMTEFFVKTFLWTYALFNKWSYDNNQDNKCIHIKFNLVTLVLHIMASAHLYCVIHMGSMNISNFLLEVCLRTMVFANHKRPTFTQKIKMLLHIGV